MAKNRPALIRHKLVAVGVEKRIDDLSARVRIEIQVRGVKGRKTEDQVRTVPFWEEIRSRNKDPEAYKAWVKSLEPDGLFEFDFYWVFNSRLSGNDFQVCFEYTGLPGFVYTMRQAGFPSVAVLQEFAFIAFGLGSNGMAWTQAADFLETHGATRLASILREFASVCD